MALYATINVHSKKPDQNICGHKELLHLIELSFDPLGMPYSRTEKGPKISSRESVPDDDDAIQVP